MDGCLPNPAGTGVSTDESSMEPPVGPPLAAQDE